ncbi:MAG: hypothetical protein J5741_06505 [Bacteroidales bacterium]|nr:hypothetical protein [Bacteroidales bacterium]
MKKNTLITLLIVLAAGFMMQTNAQAPYKHGFGVTLGTTQALSYKTFPCNHFAIQFDVGTKYCYVYGSHLWSVELAPNFMYEGRLSGDLFGFVGAGGSIGYTWNNYFGYFNEYGQQWSRHNAKGGLNGIFGLEYLIDSYLALQFDFRPGYRCIFNFDGLTDHTFDWGLNFGVRYTF